MRLFKGVEVIIGVIPIMIKKLSTGFFLLLLILGNLSYAQSGGASTRIYSGYLHTKKQVDRDKTCSLDLSVRPLISSTDGGSP